jgi:hypothetical protein
MVGPEGAAEINNFNMLSGRLANRFLAMFRSGG